MSQNAIIHLFTCSTLCVFIYVNSHERTKINTFIFLVVLWIVPLMLGYAFSIAAGKYIAQLYGYEMSGYVEGYILHDSSSIGSLIKALLNYLVRFPKYFLEKSALRPEYRIYIISSIVVLLYSLYQTIRKKSIVDFLTGCMAVFSSIAIIILTGSVELNRRILVDMRMLVGVSCAFFVNKLVSLRTPRFVPRLIQISACALTVLLVFNQSKATSQIFYTGWLRSQLDQNMMHSIGTMLKGETKGQETKPVIFMGVPDSYNLDYEESEGVSIFSWDRVYGEADELKSKRLYPYFNMHGYQIRPSMNYDEKLIRLQISNIPEWPQEGCVKSFDDYILVKIGTPLYERSEMQYDDFIRKYNRSGRLVEGHSDWFSFDPETRILEMGGWLVFIGVPSSETKIRLALVGDLSQYILMLHSKQDPGITSYLNDGLNYDSGRYELYPKTLDYVESGNYDLFLLLETEDESIMVPLEQVIFVAQ